ncbi:MAG: ParB/Srx family N-terminal domain-containing protein [Bdellovibrionaceae bacterium]|nr:ParB/Srx family N-terminal domain-containing protein [Pseudobdellovibrionaceae bacterium]
MKENDVFKIRVLQLRPTQFAVGMLEVDQKIKDVRKLKKSKLNKYLKENVVPVVCGPDEELYVVDKHHFLLVCHSVGVRKVWVTVVKDLRGRKITFLQFWKWMLKTRNTYPYCQFGEGPRKPYYLPHDIRGLADDPYRSIAWFVRKAGGYENTDLNFAEFEWANFFRSKNLLDREGIAGLTKAAERALKIARTPAAKNLPGYIGHKKGQAPAPQIKELAKRVRKAAVDAGQS